MRSLAARGRRGAVLTILAAIGLAITGYLLAVRWLGEVPACGPVRGCDTVAASPYATVAGLPVALFGVGFSVVLVALTAAWWRRADRRALQGAYALGLVGVVAVGYLTFIEVVVLEAICIWCVSYAITVVAGWLLAIGAVRGTA